MIFLDNKNQNHLICFPTLSFLFTSLFFVGIPLVWMWEFQGGLAIGHSPFSDDARRLRLHVHVTRDHKYRIVVTVDRMDLCAGKIVWVACSIIINSSHFPNSWGIFLFYIRVFFELVFFNFWGIIFTLYLEKKTIFIDL